MDRVVRGMVARGVVRGAAPVRPTRGSRQADRVGRLRVTVDEMQTPYVRPQDKGNRTDVRWAAIGDGAGGVMPRHRLELGPAGFTFELTQLGPE